MLLFVCMNSFIGTKEAAKRLRISIRRVQALIATGRLPAERIGNSFAIKESDLKVFSYRPNGRPANGRTRSEKHWDAIIDKFAGKHDFGPGDLATNKKHLEGLGRD